MGERFVSAEELQKNAIMILENLDDFQHLMMCYNAAMLTVKTKLDILNIELTQEERRLNPVDAIHCRLKEPLSIIKKLERRKLPLTLQSIGELTDIAGLRVVCAFLSDLSLLSNYLLKQDGVILVTKKDYIKQPKPNGYRSLHLIIQVPVYLSTKRYELPVEVQFRTLAMDLWASNEHRLCYKQDLEDPDVKDALKNCADAIARVDLAMEKIKDEVTPHTL